MKLFYANDKLLNILSFFIALIPLSLLSGSLIINILTIFISITLIAEILVKKNLKFFHDWSFYLLIFLWISFFVNLIFSQDPSLSISRTVGFARFIFLIQAVRYLFLYKDQSYKNNVLKFWLIIFLFVSLDLLFEYFNGHNILGFESNLKGRLASFLGEELKIGGYYFGFALVALATIFNMIDKNYKVVFISAIIVLVISFLIGERSNFIKILISILIIFPFYFKEHKYKLLALMVVFLLLFSSVIYKNDNLRYRYLTQWNNQNVYENIYFTHYKTALLVFEKYPIFGSGIKNFRVEVRKIIEEKYKDNKIYNNWQIITTHPHQINFEILSETGVFGYLCYLIFFLTSFYKAFRQFPKENNLLLLATTTFCIIYINPILPSGSFFTTYDATIFWTNFGIMISFLSKNKKIY